MLAMSSHPNICAPRHRHIRLLNAIDIVSELLREASDRGCALALFVLPGGEFRVMKATGMAYDGVLMHDPASLVGVYTGAAEQQEIIDDIYARCEQLGMEWPLVPEI